MIKYNMLKIIYIIKNSPIFLFHHILFIPFSYLFFSTTYYSYFFLFFFFLNGAKTKIKVKQNQLSKIYWIMILSF